jgi:hypothetical protein
MLLSLFFTTALFPVTLRITVRNSERAIDAFKSAVE